MANLMQINPALFKAIKNKAHEEFEQLKSSGYIAYDQRGLSNEKIFDEAVVNYEKHFALIVAARYGNLPAVVALYEQTYIFQENLKAGQFIKIFKRALEQASFYNHIDVVKYLLTKVEPDNYYEWLVFAFKHTMANQSEQSVCAQYLIDQLITQVWNGALVSASKVHPQSRIKDQQAKQSLNIPELSLLASPLKDIIIQKLFMKIFEEIKICQTLEHLVTIYNKCLHLPFFKEGHEINSKGFWQVKKQAFNRMLIARLQEKSCALLLDSAGSKFDLINKITDQKRDDIPQLNNIDSLEENIMHLMHHQLNRTDDVSVWVTRLKRFKLEALGKTIANDKKYHIESISIKNALGAGGFNEINAISVEFTNGKQQNYVQRKSKEPEDYANEEDIKRLYYTSKISKIGFIQRPYTNFISKESILKKKYKVEYLEHAPGGSIDKFPVNHAELPLLFSQLIRIVYEMHKEGFFHGDIKPENILLTADGRVKLSDLDFLTHKNNITYEINGTPYYCAENDELFKGKYKPDLLRKARDIWGLGATLYNLYLGVTEIEIYKNHALREFRLNKLAETHPAVVALVKLLCDHDPVKRVENFDKLCQEDEISKHEYFDTNEKNTFLNVLYICQEKPAGYENLTPKNKILWLKEAIKQVGKLAEFTSADENSIINNAGLVLEKHVCNSNFLGILNEYEYINDCSLDQDSFFMLLNKEKKSWQKNQAVENLKESYRQRLLKYREAVKEHVIADLKKQLTKLEKASQMNPDKISRNYVSQTLEQNLKSKFLREDIKDYAEQLITANLTKLRLKLRVPTILEWQGMLRNTNYTQALTKEANKYVTAKIKEYHDEIIKKSKEEREEFLRNFGKELFNLNDSNRLSAIDILKRKVMQEIDALNNKQFAEYTDKDIIQQIKPVGRSHIPTVSEWLKLSKRNWLFCFEKSYTKPTQKLTALIKDFYQSEDIKQQKATALSLAQECIIWLSQKSFNSSRVDAVHELLARTISHLENLYQKESKLIDQDTAGSLRPYS